MGGATLPTSTSAGTVYFAKTTTYNNKNFGELYYDDSGGARVKIAPKLSSVTFNTGTATNPEFYINVEDGSKITASMPVAGESQWGVITTGNQDFSGAKGFSNIKIHNNSQNPHQITNVFDADLGEILKISCESGFAIETPYHSLSLIPNAMYLETDNYAFLVGHSNEIVVFGITDNNNNGIMLVGDTLATQNITGTTITADSFVGPLTGNASTASKLQTSVNINGTAFDGSTAITTQAWGMERTISIDDEAGTTGTATTGAANITLVIPATMTGFTSITSTTLLATDIGTASSRIGTIRPNSIVLYQSGYTGGTTIARDAANTTAYTLHLPSASGRLVYHTKDTAIGSVNIPVYISSTGQVTACGAVNVEHGGTGTTTAPTKGGVIYASSTSAYGCSVAGTSGYLLQSGGTDAPTWIQPTDSNTGNTIVKRDSSGNFSADTITATLSGNATTATTLANTKTIDGINFNGSTNIVRYGTCSTAAATVAKTVAVSGFVLKVGATATVKFSYSNTASNPTLNVNSTGAKPIYYNGAAITSSYLVANRVYTFVYDGTNYLVVGDINVPPDISYKDAVQCLTAGGTAAKVGTASYYNLSNNRYFFVMIANANTYAGAITLNINSSGAKTIYINGSASSSSNYTLPAGLYHVYYDGTYYRFRTNSTFLDGCFTRSYVNTTTSNTNYYLLGASGTGDQSLYRAYNSSGSANNGGCYFNGSTGVLYGAAWNDYAEFRTCNDNFIPGQVVKENGDDTLQVTKCRLERGCSIISDTFGFAIGETEKAKCPIAVSGRVLAYPYESRDEFKKYIGYPVCSGPYGTVSIMTEEEEKLYPSCIIGTISAVPEYEFWGQNNIEVNNRVWIKIK